MFAKRMFFIVSLVLLGICLATGVAQAVTTFDDFTTDPNIATQWTQTTLYGTNKSSAVWNSGTGDLTLSSPTGTNWDIEGIRRTTPDSTRSATDPVTLTINSVTTIPDSTYKWARMDLMISSVPDITWYPVSGKRYTFGINFTAASTPQCLIEVMRDVTSLYKSVPFNFSSPITLDIVPNGGSLDFKVNGATVVSDNAYASGDLPYYSMEWGSTTGTSMSATVDNFGVPGAPPVPEPGTITLLAAAGLAGLLAYAWRKRK